MSIVIASIGLGLRVMVRVPVRVRVRPLALVRKRATRDQPHHYPNGPGEQVVKVRACGQVRSEYSCRCHGKRVISAPSKPLKLKLAGPGQLGTFVILYCYINMVKLDCGPKDFVRRRFVLAIFAIRSEKAYSRFSAINFISPQRSNAEQNPLVRTFIIPQTIPLPSYSIIQLQRIKLHIVHRNHQFKTRDNPNHTLTWGDQKYCYRQ